MQIFRAPSRWLQVAHATVRCMGVQGSMSKVVVATTLREDGRTPVRVAADVAERLGAELTVLGSMPELEAGSIVSPGDPALARVNAWVESALPPGIKRPLVAARGGLPGVEIPRFAESIGAELIVVGKCASSDGPDALADAVLRRSRMPCLVLPCHWVRLDPLLVALDGSERGFQVHLAASRIARRLRVAVAVVTVDAPERESVASGPSTRSLRLLARVQATSVGAGAATLAPASEPVHVRRGDVVREVLAEVLDAGAGLLAVGWRWGGPSDCIPFGSIGRRLALGAACGVLAIPL